jgi:hypothetical protein
MAWFSFLKEQGYFDPKENPEPIQVKDGFQVPYWNALDYLEKLSLQIAAGNETELTEDLLAVIEDVSEHPKDNYRTWYQFIKILSNLPNDKIPIDILKFVPVWMGGRFDTMIQTSELMDKLLPKFLNDTPSRADGEKAELILHYLFQVEKAEIQDGMWDGEGNSYRSRLYLHFLSDKFDKGSLAPKVVRYCSSNIILELGRTIKFLLLDYPEGINAIVNDGIDVYEVRIYIEKENLVVVSKLKGNEFIHAPSILANWENKSAGDLKNELISILKQQNINYTPNPDKDDIFQRLIFALNNDLSSAFGFNSIRTLGDRYSHNEKVLNVFALIFRELLDEKAKHNPNQAMDLLETLWNDRKYQLPFYKRIALYVICENWDMTKSLFWKVVNSNDPFHLFSIYKYQKELYDLLQKNQKALSQDEIIAIEKIVNQGQQGEVNTNGENQEEYWKLRWYAALKDIQPFKEKYLSLSNVLKITNEHYENLGQITVRSGSISPISKEDLLEKSNKDIAEYIRNFRCNSPWEDPNINGLSETLAGAVEEQPEKFANEIEFYQDIAYIYSYRMINAFGEAWKKHKIFNWKKVLEYCFKTLESEKFISGALKAENDTSGATADWVVGSIAHLITDGLQYDENSFDASLLPIAKRIVETINFNLKRADNFSGTNTNYPTYSLNSTEGKSLRALLDYSLYRARNLFKNKTNNRWEKEIRNLFEVALQNKILDAYILIGMYFEQFYFLDKDWAIERVKQFYEIEKREWLAFMGGISFGNRPFDKNLYEIFYYHYERAVTENTSLNGLDKNGLIRHLTSFYFWKYESLQSEKLLFKFLNQATPELVGQLIHFISQQKRYQSRLNETEKHEFQQMILELWEYLVNKYEISSTDEEKRNLGALAGWIIFVPELDETYTKLILKSCPHVDKTHATHELLEKLTILKNDGNPQVSAKSVGEMLSSLNFRDYINEMDKDLMKDLVSFLFAHGQKQIAAEFCNKLASMHQQFFLREIYDLNMAK